MKTKICAMALFAIGVSASVSHARYYEPETARFLQEDPILEPMQTSIFQRPDFLELAGNRHLWIRPKLLFTPDRQHPYAYVGNNTLRYTDPYGLLFGIPAGESYGEEAAQYWANLYAETGNPLYYVPGAAASLWTPETSNLTCSTLAGGYAARVLGPFSPRGLPPGIGRARRYIRFDPPHHGKGWHPDGEIIKWLLGR